MTLPTLARVLLPASTYHRFQLSTLMSGHEELLDLVDAGMAPNLLADLYPFDPDELFKALAARVAAMSDDGIDLAQEDLRRWHQHPAIQTFKRWYASNRDFALTISVCWDDTFVWDDIPRRQRDLIEVDHYQSAWWTLLRVLYACDDRMLGGGAPWEDEDLLTRKEIHELVGILGEMLTRE